jgi:alpha/beta hydrolase fold
VEMRPRTVYRELTAAAILAASYPVYFITRRVGPYGEGRGEPLILLHGFGGHRSNLIALAAYLRMAGFSHVTSFQYPYRQSIAESAGKLAKLVESVGAEHGVHLIGHSLGGTIARRFSFDYPEATRSLITLSSPYSHDQESPFELGIFGDEDPIVPPPQTVMLHPRAFKKVIVLPHTGHLGILYHRTTLQLIESELGSNLGTAD